MKLKDKQLNNASITVSTVIKDKKQIKHQALKFALKIFIIFLILGSLAAGTWQIIRSRQGKILPRINIAGQNVGGKTATEAKTIVDAYIVKINAQGPKITFADMSENKTFNPKLSELGVSFDSQKTITEAYSIGRRGDWQTRVKENAELIYKDYSIKLLPTIDEKKLDEYLGTIDTVVAVEPINSTLAYTNNEFRATQSKNGRGLDKTYLKNAVSDFIQNNTQKTEITLKTVDLLPAIAEDTALLAKPQADQYLQAAPIEIVFEDKNFVVSRAEIASWIQFSTNNKSLKVEISSSKMGTFINSIAKQIEIEKIDREVTDGTGEIRAEGQDGRGVDTDKITSEIRSRLNTGIASDKIVIIAFVISKGQTTYYPSSTPGRLPGRYIDINLSEQTLYAYEGTQLVNQFLISSGTYLHPTPIGQFSVYGKSRVTEMKGDGYDLPGVEWVSWWSGDYSIHGTYWHHNFGHRMSHGCINASNADAEWIYNWDEIGTPVYVHN